MFKKLLVILFVATLIIGSFSLNVVSKNENNRFNRILRTAHSPIEIIGNDDFNSQNGVTSGAGTKENPYIIENLRIKYTLRDLLKGFNGISIKNTTAYFVIKNCYCSFIDGRISYYIFSKLLNAVSCGINLHNVSNGGVENCILKGLHQAINIENNSRNNYVFNCKSIGCFCGIGVNRLSTCNIVDNCHTFNYGCGICLWENVYNNIVCNSSCRRVGFFIHKSYNNTLMDCTSYFCRGNGLLIYENSYNNTVKESHFYSNKIGMTVRDNSNKNIIFHNNFIGNLKQAVDEDCNQWDDGVEGNYWKNYHDVDENDDLIWDNPRQISGGENQDRYPLVEKFNE